jgi:hypothetical protein
VAEGDDNHEVRVQVALLTARHASQRAEIKRALELRQSRSSGSSQTVDKGRL